MTAIAHAEPPAHPSRYPIVCAFNGHLITIEPRHVETRAELLKRWNPRITSTDWQAEALSEAERGDVQHWTFLSPAIEADYLDNAAAVEERSNPPNYREADELRRQARALRARSV